MDSCDVLIVGGGPAGSSCAWALRSSGLHVMVVDQARFPRNKVCGGWITPYVLQALEIDPRAYAQGRTCQPIAGFRISSMGRQDVEIAYGRPVSYGIRRCEFDDYLLRRSGARICDGVSIRTVERFSDGWRINGNWQARVLVGAGGHFCPIARHLGNRDQAEPVVAQEAEFEMDAGQAAACSIRQEFPELYFCHDLQGYGWCFRKDNFLNVGLGRLDRHALPRHVNEFLKFLRATGKLKFDLPHKMTGHAYYLAGRSGRQVVDDAVLLIGDAAGLAYVQSGEGIRPAVESGLLAARVIRQAGGRYVRERLQPYSDCLNLAFPPEQRSAPASRMPRSLRNMIARLLLQTNWFCRRIVVERWFLHENPEQAVGP
jgi:geranylgeranyl reductase family protein